MFNKVSSFNRNSWKQRVGRHIKAKYGYSKYARAKRNYRRAIRIKARRGSAASTLQRFYRSRSVSNRWRPSGMLAKRLASRFYRV